MKKWFILLGCCVAFFLSACGGNANNNSVSTNESIEAAELTTSDEINSQTEKEEEPTVIESVNENTVEETDEKEKEEIRAVYTKCIDNIRATGERREDAFFTGYEYAMPVAPGTTDYMRGAVGATDDSDDLWLLFEFSGTDAAMQGFEWTIDINGEEGIYEINLPLTLAGQDSADQSALISGSFDIATYNKSNSFTADEVVFSDPEFVAEESLIDYLKAYPEEVIPTTIDMLKWWLSNNGLGISLSDLGIGISASTGSGSSNRSDTSNGSGTFTNAFGTPTTKCAHPGCNNSIASSGDTNCCTVHSNRCADCGKYIDEDAMYCLDCLTKAANGSASSGTPKTGNSSSKKSSKKCTFKENGVEVCNNEAEDGSPYCSYHKKYLDDAYNSLIGH